MPDFITTAIELSKHNIAVASILPEQTDEVRTDARELLKDFGDKPPGAWFVDRAENPLNRILRVQSVPVVVLLDADGRVLFNGHPADEKFWNAVVRLAPTAVRPPSPDGH